MREEKSSLIKIAFVRLVVKPDMEKKMSKIMGFALMVISFVIALKYGDNSWVGVCFLIAGAIVFFLPNPLHFKGGIHRPCWTEWTEDEGWGSTNWGLSYGPVMYEERRCEKCGVLQRRNMRRIGI